MKKRGAEISQAAKAKNIRKLSGRSFAQQVLDRITNINWTGPTPISQQLTYDLAGNITNLARESGSYTLGYDANDQLVSSSGLENRSYVYDALGNRLQDSINGPGEFVNNFLKQNAVSSFLADQEGFGEVVRETTPTQEKNYSYRADGKISGYQSGSLAVQYFYDGLDRLVAKAINDGNQYTQSFTHLEDENRVLLGKAGDNSVTTYIDGQGMAERLAEVKGGIGKAYVTDHLGSVLNSAVAGTSKAYGLFGQLATNPGISFTSNPTVYGFTGHMIDLESGLNRTVHRQYDSKVGRWLSQEPNGDEGPNLYTYTSNNPFRFVDVDGLSQSRPNSENGTSCEYYADVAYKECRSGVSTTANVTTGLCLAGCTAAALTGAASAAAPACFSATGAISTALGVAEHQGCRIAREQTLAVCKERRGEKSDPVKDKAGRVIGAPGELMEQLQGEIFEGAHKYLGK